MRSPWAFSNSLILSSYLSSLYSIVPETSLLWSLGWNMWAQRSRTVFLSISELSDSVFKFRLRLSYLWCLTVSSTQQSLRSYQQTSTLQWLTRIVPCSNNSNKWGCASVLMLGCSLSKVTASSSSCLWFELSAFLSVQVSDGNGEC